MAYNIRNSHKFFYAFFPLKLFLTLTGQMPYTQHELPDGTLRFRFRYLSIGFIRYVCVVLFYTFIYLWLTLGLLSFMLGYNEGAGTTTVMDPITKQLLSVSFERELIRLQMVPIFVVWSWLTMIIFSAAHLLLHGREYAHFINHWSRVMCILDTDCTKGVRRSLWISNGYFLSILSVLIGMFVVGVVWFPDMTGILSASDAIATLLFRIFKVHIQEENNGKPKELYRVVGFCVICFAYTGSRAIITQFLFFQKLLRNLAYNWNCRLINCLESCRTQRKGDQTKRRTDFPRLLKDHLTMVQIFKFTNETFNVAITIYYVMVTIGLVLELYQMANILLMPLLEYTEVTYLPARDGGMLGQVLEDSEYIRANEEKVETQNFHEFVLCLVFLVYQSVTCWMVTSVTANAYEAAFAGYNVLRRHGYMYCKSKAERNFMWSMQFIYGKSSPVMTSAHGYFTINRTLFLVLANTIINYSVAMYQLKPEDWIDEDRVVPSKKTNPNVNSYVREFLRMTGGEYFA